MGVLDFLDDIGSRTTTEKSHSGSFAFILWSLLETDAQFHLSKCSLGMRRAKVPGHSVSGRDSDLRTDTFSASRRGYSPRLD